MSEIIFKSFVAEVKEFNDSDLTITAYITTKNVDRFGDVVRPDGMDNKNYRKNPVVLFGHDHDSLPIARSLWEKKDEKGVRSKMQFDAGSPYAKEIYRLYKEGFLNAFSIGFLPKQNGFETITDKETGSITGRDFKDWELLEFSAVPVPANPHALEDAYTEGLIQHQETIEKCFACEGFEDFVKSEKEKGRPENIIAKIGEKIDTCGTGFANGINEIKVILKKMDTGSKDGMMEQMHQMMVDMHDKMDQMMEIMDDMNKPKKHLETVRTFNPDEIIQRVSSRAVREKTGK